MKIRILFSQTQHYTYSIKIHRQTAQVDFSPSIVCREWLNSSRHIFTLDLIVPFSPVAKIGCDL